MISGGLSPWWSSLMEYPSLAAFFHLPAWILYPKLKKMILRLNPWSLELLDQLIFTWSSWTSTRNQSVDVGVYCWWPWNSPFSWLFLSVTAQGPNPGSSSVSFSDLRPACVSFPKGRIGRYMTKQVKSNVALDPYDVVSCGAFTFAFRIFYSAPNIPSVSNCLSVTIIINCRKSVVTF